MADDRFDPEPPVAADDPAALADMTRWLDENHAWVNAKVQEALDDPRPSLTPEEVQRRAEQRYARMRERFGR